MTSETVAVDNPNSSAGEWALRMLIVSDSLTTSTKIRHSLSQHGVDCPNTNAVSIADAHALLESGSSDTDLIFLVLPDNLDRSLAELRYFNEKSPASLIAVGATTEPRRILEAVQAGADSYLDEQGDLPAQVEACLKRLKVRSSSSATDNGRLVVVAGASGGSGTSMIASNLSVLLAKQYGQCGLLDLNRQRGTQSALFDLSPRYTIADLCRELDNLDQNMLRQTIASHATGVQLIAAPHRLAEQSPTPPGGLRKLCDLARNYFPALVVDFDDIVDQNQTGLLQAADTILVPFRLDFPSLRNLRLTLEHWDEIGIPSQNVHLVVNRFGQRNELPARKVEEAIHRKFIHCIPEDPKSLLQSVNRGAPIVFDNDEAAVSRSLLELGAKLGIIQTEPAAVSVVDQINSFSDSVFSKLASIVRGVAPRTAGHST